MQGREGQKASRQLSSEKKIKKGRLYMHARNRAYNMGGVKGGVSRISYLLEGKGGKGGARGRSW